MTAGAATNDFAMVDLQHWIPTNSVVASLAHRAAIDMSVVFADRTIAIMTTHAGLAIDTTVVEYRDPRLSAMAVVAACHCLHMVQGLTSSGMTVVTIFANTDDFLVIKINHRFPAGIVMARITQVTAVNMSQCFTLRLVVVVTTDAGLADDIGMIELHLPRGGFMAL